MLKGFELIDSAGPLLAEVIDDVTHLDLRIDVAVEALVSDRLREEQQHDAYQAQAADCCQHGISVGTNHLSYGEVMIEKLYLTLNMNNYWKIKVAS